MPTLLVLVLTLAGLVPAEGLLAQMEQELVRLVANLSPSLLTVIGAGTAAGAREATLGSGLAVGEDGLVLTSRELADPTEQLAVELPDGRRLQTSLVGEDHRTGLALLRAEGAHLTAAHFGDPQQLRPGSWVLVLGRQLGSLPSISPGLVWGLAPRSGVGDPMIQISAVAPAPDGGTVIGSRGEVVGMVVDTDSEGPGAASSPMVYAVPADQAAAVAQRIAAHGSKRAAYLGVNIQELTPRLQKLFELPSAAGILISEVVSGGPAEQAGLRRGDVVVRIDRDPVETTQDLMDQLERREPGQAVELEVMRGSQSQRYTVTLGERPRGERLRSFLRTPRFEMKLGGAFLGIQPQPLTDQLREHFGAPRGSGVLVAEVDPDSPAAQAGLQAGDILLRVGEQDISSPFEIAEALRESKPGDQATVVFLRDGRQQQVDVTLSKSDQPNTFFFRSWPEGGFWESPEGPELREHLESLRPLLRRHLEEDLAPELEQGQSDLRRELEDLRGQIEALKRELKEKLGNQ